LNKALQENAGSDKRRYADAKTRPPQTAGFDGTRGSKALHVIAVSRGWQEYALTCRGTVVYHCEAEDWIEASETVQVMERGLLKAIINRPMIVNCLLRL